jgi:four helix bundle protein
MAEPDTIESFRDLVVWQLAMDAADGVFDIVEQEPLRKKYWLCDQICRAVSSVGANLAEGHGSGTRRVYVKHCYIARGSLCESLSFIELLRRRELADPRLLAKVEQQVNPKTAVPELSPHGYPTLHSRFFDRRLRLRRR